MGVDYIDVEHYSQISWELSKLGVDVKSIINIETKKRFFRIWYKKVVEVK